MLKFLIVILYTLTISSALQLTMNLLKEILEKSIVTIPENDRPTRVRTTEELKKKSGKCVILDFIGIVEQYRGYTAEEYNVTTEDGYILKLHRISGSPSYPKDDGKPVVFFNHGLLTDSDYYALNGPDLDLVYLLADKGYDVWLGNVRGTAYSRSHVKYSPSNAKFWEFSLDELALIDTPTVIDFVLKQTGQEKLTFIAYSMGTTEIFMLLSFKLEYNKKINLLICMAPIVYDDISISELLKEFIRIVLEISGKLKVYEIFPLSCMNGEVGSAVCSTEPNLCAPLLRSVCEVNNINISYTLPKYMKYSPAGTSHRLIDHYKQLIDGGKFQRYDFSYQRSNKSLNKKKYNQTNPPEYDVSLVTTPVALFCAPNDIFVPLKRAELLRKHLPNVVAFNLIPDKNFNHIDFFWNINAKELVYDSLIDVMTRQLKDQRS